MKTKKKYGQHFLIDNRVIDDIAGAVILASKEHPNVLEVGPGGGALTGQLINNVPNYCAVEVDADLIPVLIGKMPQIEDKLIYDDFLKLNLETVFDQKEFLLTGNYPYNISSQIIFHMMDYKEYIPVMIGMFQKEVAMRIISPHGSKVYGVISVLIQLFYDCELLFHIGPDAFDPPPKVMSSVIKLTRKEKPYDVDLKLFRQVVKTSFNSRRKMLRNTLKPMINDPELIKDPIFEKRPEHLDVQDFVNLTNNIANQEI